MIQKALINAYDGADSYAFVSYSHTDDKRVLPVIAFLTANKYRVWYDEGIVAGESWPQKIALRLRDASVFIAFTSKSFFRSQNCMREIHYAVANNEAMLWIDLDGSEAPEEMKLQLSVAPKIEATELDGDEIAERLINGLLPDSLKGGDLVSAPQRKKTRKRLNPWMIAAVTVCLLFLCLVFAVVGYFKGIFTLPDGTLITPVNAAASDSGETVTYIEWNNSVTRSVFLTSLNSDSVYICGNKCVSSPNAFTFDGVWRVLESPVENGGITSLDELGNMAQIKQLSLIYQEITDISGIGSYPALTYLDLSGNEITDISPLAELPRLETLLIRHVPAENLAILRDIPSLARVYISYDMAEAAESLLDANFDLIIKN